MEVIFRSSHSYFNAICNNFRLLDNKILFRKGQRYYELKELNTERFHFITKLSKSNQKTPSTSKTDNSIGKYLNHNIHSNQNSTLIISTKFFTKYTFVLNNSIAILFKPKIHFLLTHVIETK